MFKLDKDELIILLAGALMIQSGWALSLALASRRHTMEANKFADIAQYYVDILVREDIELEDFDLIALSTMYND